ncbi:hypothetical protein O988_02423, partial [Pseudogymnoascus sp. VKM F-3808]
SVDERYVLAEISSCKLSVNHTVLINQHQHTSSIAHI